MRRFSILVVRWGIGVLFILNGLNNIFRYPISAVLAIIFGLYAIPLVENQIYKQLKKKPPQWVRLGVLGLLFALFNISLPRSAAPSLVEPSPLPSASIVATASASPVSSVSATATASALPSPSVLGTATPSANFFPVVKITDGDTFKVEIEGKVDTVRIVGIDTPETVDSRRPVQCFGKEASAKAKDILTGQKVRLESDATQQDRDRYNRLLRFVFLEDGSDVGLKMIQEGYAQESLYSSTPHIYRDSYLAAQKEAKENKKGLWADDACVKE